MNDCLFCKIIAGDIPSEKLYEDDDAMTFRDVTPQAPQYFPVNPYDHFIVYFL